MTEPIPRPTASCEERDRPAASLSRKPLRIRRRFRLQRRAILRGLGAPSLSRRQVFVRQPNPPRNLPKWRRATESGCSVRSGSNRIAQIFATFQRLGGIASVRRATRSTPSAFSSSIDRVSPAAKV